MSAKILVIDDEESIRFTFENFLSDEGYEVTTAGDFEEALARLTGADIDVVFTDIILGNRTGVDILREVRKRKNNCPVIMITGYPNVETASEAIRLGAFDYIPKPVRQAALLHVAKMALQHKTLLEENEKYRRNLEAIFRSIKDAVITVDKDMNVVEVNDAAGEICGVDRAYIGKPFNASTAGCSGKCMEALKKTIADKQDVELGRMECRFNEQPGQVVTITTTPLLDSLGEFSGAVMIVRDETRINSLERDLRERHQFHNIVSKNEKMQKIYDLIEDLADVQTTVLITGESGTGKELVADAIHYAGSRSGGPLIKVNCSALTETLLESELFGYVKGAFTGADRDKTGRFQKADGGTIFLDEIGDISSRMQLRLLRVLQEKVVERVGDSTPIKVDVRVLAATNQDLPRKVRLGQFREDLYYRLKVMELSLPPLRERRDDIPLLTDHFIGKLNKKLRKHIEFVSEDVQGIFMDYPWPGNIREMENTLEHAFIVCRQDTITVDHLPQNMKAFFDKAMPSSLQHDGVGPEAVIEALEKAGGNKSKAARLLGVTVRTIYRKIEKFNIATEKD
ncbi:MAG: sigma 54-interacting transcriptional regulator [Nitrospirae bacterium]|nr:sigma 54-interacting transcriptional regulator [Nitrospirota bacterium]